MSDQRKDFDILFKVLDMDPKRAAQLATENKAARERYERFRTDIPGFAKYYFPHYIKYDPAGWHKTLSKIFETTKTDPHSGRPYWTVTPEIAAEIANQHRPEFRSLPQPCDRLRAMVLCAPREQAKSTYFARIMVIWGILYGYFRFITVFRSNGELADSFIEDTAAEFGDNQRLLDDFGNLKGKVWKTGMYSFKNGAAMVSLGRGASVRGLIHREKRPDLIICDDLVTDQDAKSSTALKDLYDWIFSAITNLSKDAVLFFLNTIFNDADPQSRMLKRIGKRELPGWLGIRLSAEIEDGHRALWPEYWPISACQQKKQEIGTIKYNTEYQSILTGDDSKLVRLEWLKFIPAGHENINEYDLAVGIDPNAEGNDDAACSLVGRHKIRGTYHVFKIWLKDRGSITDLVDTFVDWLERYTPGVYAFEEVGFQKVYQKLVQVILLEQHITIPFIGAPAVGSKLERARTIGAFSENGTITYDGDLEESAAVYRLTHFPEKGLNDGVVDAIYLGWSAFNRSRGKPSGKAGKKRSSALPMLIGRYKNGY